MSHIPTLPYNGPPAASGGESGGGSVPFRPDQSRSRNGAPFLAALSDAAKKFLFDREKLRRRASLARAQNGAGQPEQGQQVPDSSASLPPVPAPAKSAVATDEDDQVTEAQAAALPAESSPEDAPTEVTIQEVISSQAPCAAQMPQPIAPAVSPKSEGVTASPAQTAQKSIDPLVAKSELVAAKTSLSRQDEKDRDRTQENDSSQPPVKAEAEPPAKVSPPPAAFQAGDKSKHSKQSSKSESQAVDAAESIAETTATRAPEAPASAGSAESVAAVSFKAASAPSADAAPAEDSSVTKLLTPTLAAPTLSSAAEVAPPAQEPPAADATDPMDQVILGLKSKLDARSGKAEIRLDPPNLGAVKVSLSLDSGNLTAQFESSSEMVRDLLKSNLDKLKTVLEGQGVSVDRLAVEPPADTQPQGQSGSFGSATHDGRSAGQYFQEQRSSHRSQEANGFASLFRQAQDGPLDLVA